MINNKRDFNTNLKTQRKCGVPIFSYRLMGLNESTTKDLLGLLGKKFYCTVSTAGSKQHIILVQFNARNYRLLLNIISKLSLPASVNQTLWVSLLTIYASHGVTLPKYIMAFVQQAGCGVDFSFTVC